jgi:hypothetical protein
VEGGREHVVPIIHWATGRTKRPEFLKSLNFYLILIFGVFDFVYGNHKARLKRLQINNFFYLRKVECDGREIVFGVRTHKGKYTKTTQTIKKKTKKKKTMRPCLVIPFSYFMSFLIWPPPKSRHDATRPLQSDKRERVGMHRCFAARCHSHPKIPLPLSHFFNSLGFFSLRFFF